MDAIDCAGVLALQKYLRVVAGAKSDALVDRTLIERAFATMASFEHPLTHRLVSYLASRSDVITMIGQSDPSSPSRCATISFIHKTKHVTGMYVCGAS
jgi:selenocysteine lyase/cysteine desulfurase